MSQPPTIICDVQDPARLARLKSLDLLDSPAEEAFDRLTRLASAITGAPVALVSLVDDRRQFFKSAVGLPEPWASRRETPLSHSFCQHVVARAEPLIVADAREHPLVRDNLAVPDLGVVAYAGIPLVLSTGEVLGSFCVVDTKPREWTSHEIAALTDIAASVISEIELRQASVKAKRDAVLAEQAKLERTALLNAVGQGVYGVDLDGRCTLINRAALDMLGYELDEVLGRSMHDLIHHTHPDGSQFPQEECPLVQSFQTGRPVELDNEILWRKDGTFFTAEYSSFPITSDENVTGSVVTFLDVSQRGSGPEEARPPDHRQPHPRRAPRTCPRPSRRYLELLGSGSAGSLECSGASMRGGTSAMHGDLGLARNPSRGVPRCNGKAGSSARPGPARPGLG
jgi:PAS domain S-box-containing protein